uniref:Pectinesterase inhibitor domain-containing protein n=1 Tax=Oryza punctata TaxID=4537 RepID=A0A0E0JNI0_ORYPU
MTLAGAPRRRRATRSRLPPTLLLIVLLLLGGAPRASALRIPLREVATLLNLSRSLLNRVAAARAARGDAIAASRARRIASHLSLFSSRGAWALSWDYLRHYAFSSAAGCGLSCATAAARLLAAAAEVSRLHSATDAAQWLRRNYVDVRDAAAQLLNGLLVAFSEQGPLREVVMDVKWEVEEGELLKDCLKVGSKDLEGLLVIAKDLLFGAARTSSRHNEL